MSYAKGTAVPVERSRAEVERVLTKYGADQFSSGWSRDKAVILFRMNLRLIRIEMPIPKLQPECRSWEQKKGLYYSADKVAQESRRRWRAMLLYLKAKLESVESEIVSFEEAFMSHIVLPNKQTVAEFMKPQIETAYTGGKMPLALPGY